MNPDFYDIVCAAGREPEWFYGHDGVPRFISFSPDELGVYDHYALLVEIACQSCGRRFNVGVGWPRYSAAKPGFFYSLEELAEGYHFGDPPLHRCAGDSMNCVDLRIIEAWEKGKWDANNGGYPWQRRADVEAYDIVPDWLADWQRTRLGLDDEFPAQ